MLKQIKLNKDKIIQLKKAAIKTKDCSFGFKDKSEASKQDNDIRKIEFGDPVKVAMNTAYYVDYDLDMGIEGTWKRSVDQQNGKTFHVVNHDLKVGSVVAYPKDVTVTLEKVMWSDLGKNYSGFTEVLIFTSTMSEKTQKDAFMAYRDGDPVQHSIRLRYIQLELAMNSLDPGDKEEKAIWDKYYPMAVNKEVPNEYGYFWVMKESQVYKEGSTVLLGANEITPQLKDINGTHDNDPSKDTHQSDPPESEKTREFYLNYLK
jgi:hypothetical protein